MARLNEPSVPTESIEALKRRFIRQNREIARANSTQSLRIRNLEAETSRLLSENIALREQVIKLQLEVDGIRGRYFVEDVGTVKTKLEEKLAELGSLVVELGGLGNGGRHNRSSPRKPVRASPKRSPDQKNWKNALTLSEAAGGLDGRLPPIVEGKYFPRRTMDAEELLQLFSDPASTVDSPDLGPPPVAHFEEGDPIKFDAGKRVGEAAPGTGDELPQALSANLETRKKRRESSHSSDLGRSQKTEISAAQRGNELLTSSSAGPCQSLKSGAKRKLSVRDDEEHMDAPKSNEKEAFRFHRRNTPAIALENPKTSANKEANLISHKVTQDLAAARGTSRSTTRETASVTEASTRPPLGPKSVNTDPVTSPMKVSKSLDKGEIGDSKKEGPKKSRDRDRAKDRPSSVKVNQPAKKQQESIASVLSPAESDSPPPETPAALPLDLFSPVTSEPSAARPESRDTPPPPDLNPDASNEDAFNAAGRISRRARGSVSYAEPNLRDKMRRPTQELVDAVGADERVQRAASTKPEGSKSEGEGANGIERSKAIRTVFIKKEDALSESSSWKSLPSIDSSKSQQERARAEATSPLGNKTTADLPASVTTDRRCRTSALHRSEDLPQHEGKPATSGSSTAIAALVAAGAGKKSRNPPPAPAAARDAPEDKNPLDEPLDIYDFNDSTPDGHDIIVLGKDHHAVPPATRSSRRPSSALASSRSAAAIPDAGAGGKEAPVVSRPNGRRRETLGSGAVAGGHAPAAAGAEEAVVARGKGLGLRAAKSVVGLGVAFGEGGAGRAERVAFGEGGAGRAERAASRRRSTVL